jgi:hypothetical protein
VGVLSFSPTAEKTLKGNIYLLRAWKNLQNSLSFRVGYTDHPSMENYI